MENKPFLHKFGSLQNTMFKKAAIFLFVITVFSSCTFSNHHNNEQGSEKKRPVFLSPLKFL